MLRKIWKIVSRTLLAVFALLILLIIGVGLFFDLDEELNAQKEQYLPELEKVLGRKVTVGEIKTTLWPDLGAHIADVVVAGKEGEEAHLLKVGRVTFEADWWSALTSFGSDVQIKALVFDGVEVNLIREADGTLSYADVVKRLAEGPPPEEAPKPLDPEVVEMIKTARLDRIAIQNSKFHMVDKATGGAPAETYINDLLLELTDVQLKDAFEVKLQAAIFAEKSNFDLRVKLGPIPIDEGDPPMPIEYVSLKADGVDLAGIVPYLGEALPVKLHKAALTADMRIDDPLAQGGHIKAGGSLKVAPLALGKAKPFDLSLSPKIELDPEAGVLDIDGFKLGLDDMSISSVGRVSGLNTTKPQFKGLKVTSSNLHLGRLKALLGPMMALPPGAVLDGPFSIQIAADGDADAQRVSARLDFDAATIVIPEAFNKTKATTLHTAIKANLSPNALALEELDLTVGGIKLALAGSVKNFDNPTIQITGGTGKFNINTPARLSPAVAKAIPPDVKIAGQGEIDIKLRQAPGAVDADVRVGVYGADLDVPGATLKGTGQIALAAKGAPGKKMKVDLDADLDGLALTAGDALRKGSGAPMDIHLSAVQSGQTVSINTLGVNFGPLQLSGSGTVSTGGGPMDVKAQIQRFKVSKMAQLVPALKDTPISGATLGMALSLKGNPAKASTVEAEMKNFFFSQKGSSLEGQLTVANLDAPKIRFNFRSPNLDLDKLLPGGEGGEEEAAEPGPPDPIIKKIDAAGSLRIAKGKAGGFPFKDFVGQLTLKNGVLRFTDLKFDAYDGKFVLTPTEANIGEAVPSFKTKIAMKRVNAQKLLSEQANLPGTITGRITTTIQIEGKGAEWKQLAKTLTGSIDLDMAEGMLKTLDLEQAIFKPLNQKFGDIIPIPKTRDGTSLGSLSSTFNVRQGQMKLAEMMQVATKQGPLQLNGAIGLDKSLDLKGTLMLSPKAISTVTGGKLKIARAIPVGINIGGNLLKPKISGIEGAALVAALAPEVAKAMGAEKALEAARKAEALAREKAAEAEKKAREVAKKAEKKAREAKKKAEKKAKKAADKAKKKAEDEAKKALKGLF